jgi:hypothetical protein
MKRYLFVALCLSICSYPHAQMQAQGIKTAWIINDDFSSNKYEWLIDSNAHYQTAIRDNHYNIWNKSEKTGRIITHGFKLDEKNNYRIEADILHSTGADDKGNGLVIAGDGGQKFYRFFITADGYFKIDKVIDTMINVIKDWEFSDAIEKGANKIALVNLNNHWSFYINEKKVYDCIALSFFGTRIGFYVSSQSSIYCTSFKIYDWTIAAGTNETKEPLYEASFCDYFSSNKNSWAIIDNEDAKASVSNGYTIQNKTTGYYLSSQEISIFDFFDYKTELAVRHTGGVNDYGFGLCFGGKNVDNTYVFMISGDGSFQIGEFIDGEWSAIKEWAKSDVIRTSNYATNYLRFEKTKGNWNFYINNSFAYTCPSKTFFGKNFGCYVENKQTAEFAYLKVSKIIYP